MILAVFLISIFTFLFLGIPVAFSILLTVLTMAEASGVTSYEIVPSYLYSGVNNFALLAIPFFVFCGDLMTAGDLSKGIVEVCRVLLGHVRAGIGYAAILACMIFAALTGAAVVTISAIGGIMLPIMIKEGYDAAGSTARVCAGSITGPIIPPSLPMVIFGAQRRVRDENVHRRRGSRCDYRLGLHAGMVLHEQEQELCPQAQGHASGDLDCL